MARDIDLLYWLAHAIVRSMPESHLYRPLSLVEEFDRSVAAELDFSLEADNHDRFTSNFQHNPYAKFPKVYRCASAKRVLTLEYLEGRKVYAAQRALVSASALPRRPLIGSVDRVVAENCVGMSRCVPPENSVRSPREATWPALLPG